MKFCMIGCGEHAIGSHGPAQARYVASHREIELAACCDVDPVKAGRYREQFGFARAYSDLDVMLDAERPDALALVVPTPLTCDLGTRVLARGIPLLLEKPPGETVGEVDRLAAAARAGGGAREVPHQVAFNRRFVPLVVTLRQRLDRLGPDAPLQHLCYEMVRVSRRDPDFSVTAVHAIDAVRFIAASDFGAVRFRYQELPEVGPGVANIFMDATMGSGMTAHLAFCPVAGAVVERAELHARDHTFFLEIPMWNGYDTPGRLVHLERGMLVEDLRGPAGEDALPFVLGGFFAEYEAFFDGLAAGRNLAPTLAAARQSVEVAEAMRARKSEWRS
jgi:predicted dehydrogenase